MILKMPWFWTIMFLSFIFITSFSAEAKHHSPEKFPSAVVVGTVSCDTCFQQDSPKSSHFIEGASVAVECKDSTSSSRPNFLKVVKTNNHGEFQVHLPSIVSKHFNKIKQCSVKLISSNEASCTITATATSSTLNLKSRKQRTRIFSAGFFTFKPLKQPEVCDQKPTIKNTEYTPNDPAFQPPIRDPQPDPPALGGSLPPLPKLPPLPVNPYLPPGLFDKKEVSNPTQFPFTPFLPPNPLLPPPSLIPPVLPSPPPSLFPPIFPSPPPSLFPPVFPTPSPPFFNLPPFPGLVPSPPPPPKSFFPPFPPFPFQPTPGFPGPGVPPAAGSSGSKPTPP